MASYGSSTIGTYDAASDIFTTSNSTSLSYTFVIANGSYEVGDGVSVTAYVNGNFVYQRTFTVIAYNSDGWVGQIGSQIVYLTNASTFPVGSQISATNGGTFVTCFLTGTLIATPEGERAVEDLAIGDLVLTADGETRPVRWIGRQTVQRMFADPVRCYPIRISAGALDDNIPARDLYVSPDHALLVDGLMVQANALINGVTITRVERPEERFTYFHIELEDHALVLAEGAPAETFVDNVTRRRFDNYAEFEALYGVEAGVIEEIDLPRVKSVRQLPESIRARLEERAGVVVAAAA